MFDRGSSEATAATTPVLVVGGGLSGFAAAAFLAHFGTSVVLVDRGAAGESTSSRNQRLNVRTMELLRSLGLDRRVRAAGFDVDDLGDVLQVDTLAGPEIARWPQPWMPAPAVLSAVQPVCCGHEQLLRMIRAHAVELGVDVRTGAQLLELREDADGVTAVLRDAEPIRASYVVGADGPHSRVREAARIGTSGPGTVATHVGVLFHADLEELVAGRHFAGVEITSVGGMLLREDTADTWTLLRPSGPDARPGDGGDPVDLVRAATGTADLAVRVQSRFTWPITLLTAERFARGRVILVGDAACSVPPVPGLNGNEVLQQAQNLAWKLAAVVRGTADPSLLDSYDAERRWLAELSLADALARVDAGPVPAELPDRLTFELGAVYRSSAVIPDVPTTQRRFADPVTSPGLPGTRAPHLEIEHRGSVIPILELFGRRPVLLAGPDGRGWTTAARSLAAHTGIDLVAYRAETDFHDVDSRWSTAFGVRADGAVLIRPDVVVGWRARGGTAEPERDLGDAVHRLFATTRT